MDVISISSSPAPEPSMQDTPARRPKRHLRPTTRSKARRDNAERAIVITDSSDEDVGTDDVRVKSAASRRNKGKAADKNEPIPIPPFLHTNHNGSRTIVPRAGPSHSNSAAAKEIPALGVVKPGASAEALADTTNKVAATMSTPAATPMDVDPPSTAKPTESLDHHLTHVLEVVPDVDPQFASELVARFIAQGSENIVELALHQLLEDANYPKVSKNKGKRKRSDEDESLAEAQAEKTTRIDYASKERPFKGGVHYKDMALAQLYNDFATIPKVHIQKMFYSCNTLYAPTHILLREQLNMDNPPFKSKVTPTRRDNKGKRHDSEFTQEREWLLKYLEGNGDDDDDDECEDGIECGCCFSKYQFDKMVQCPDAHLFCKSCLTSYVENRIGEGNVDMPCMDMSGCKLIYSDSELARVLNAKLLALYHRMKQVKEVEAAGLDGLESCPFCEYKVVIDNPDEKLFRCEQEDCGIVTCRNCKKVDHLPRTCKEVEEDKSLDARHLIEEAMTKALMRECPNCKKPFVKEQGCNKMICPNCKTMSCYVCRKVIDGYQHFESNNVGSSKKCLLWEPHETRHDREVAEARQRAIEEVRRENPDVDDHALNVDLPKTAPQPGQAHAGPHGAPLLMNPNAQNRMVLRHPVHGQLPVVVNAPPGQPIHIHYDNVNHNPNLPGPAVIHGHPLHAAEPVFGHFHYHHFNFQPPPYVQLQHQPGGPPIPAQPVNFNLQRAMAMQAANVVPQVVHQRVLNQPAGGVHNHPRINPMANPHPRALDVEALHRRLDGMQAVQAQAQARVTRARARVVEQEAERLQARVAALRAAQPRRTRAAATAAQDAAAQAHLAAAVVPANNRNRRARG